MSRTRASARSWHSSSPADAERPLAAGRKPSQHSTPHPVFPAGGCMTCAGRLRQGWLQRLGVASKSPRRCCRRRATTSCSARLHSCSRILAGYAGLGQLSRRIERRRESHPVATRECLRECLRERQAGVVALSRRKQGFESPRERQSNQLLVPNRPVAPLSFSNFSPNQ